VAAGGGGGGEKGGSTGGLEGVAGDRLACVVVGMMQNSSCESHLHCVVPMKSAYTQANAEHDTPFVTLHNCRAQETYQYHGALEAANSFNVLFS
jgi:hypothetical protein